MSGPAAFALLSSSVYIELGGREPAQDVMPHYVYFHRDGKGRVFYVGKGTGDRAWSRERHTGWLKYVSERLGGEYTVEIHRDGLTEQQAEELESQLITELGQQLVNWINPGRQFDYEALGRYHQLRDANRQFVADTRLLERTDPETAIARYRQALTALLEYEGLTLERGLVAELKVGPTWGDVGILDRLTLCLIRVGRPDEAAREAQVYFERFPSALQLASGRTVQARVRRAAWAKKGDSS